MTISTWLYNNRLDIACIEHRGYKFLVYTKPVKTGSFLMIEETNSGIREVRTELPEEYANRHFDDFVRDVMDGMIKQNFSTNL